MADADIIVSIRERLLKERHALLDLSTRNRLLNVPLRTRNNRAIEIVDEKVAEVFRLLSDGKAMTFLAGVQLSAEEKAELEADDYETGGIPQPADDNIDDKGRASRHTDLRLQTRLTSEGLQKRLFDVWYDAQTLEQEQGVNILYLALGLLRWYDADNSDLVRHAPLVLLPVQLERSSAADKFKLKWRDEPPSPNLTLQAKMKAEFSILIEDFKDEDDLDISAYAAKVAETVSGKARWEVLPDAMVLGFFSFSKFLMYRDLDPENWPGAGGIDQSPLISALLRDGFPETEPLIPDNVAIDEAIPPIELHHVVDADSSQTVAIAEAAGGRTLVIKGPPGTGKSQTITNIIAAAAARGRKVLFVSEKMAALDVVHRRLKQAGLGPLTLELHSNKVNKRALLEELKRTRDAALRPARSDLTVIQKLGDSGQALNSFASRLHTALYPCGLTPQRILGRLSRLHGYAQSGDYLLEGSEAWTPEDFYIRRNLIEEMAERLVPLGNPAEHPWCGVQCEPLDPLESDRLLRDIEALIAHLNTTQEATDIVVSQLEIPKPASVKDIGEIIRLFAVMNLPEGLDRQALVHAAWGNTSQLMRLIEAGQALSAARSTVNASFNNVGLRAELSAIRQDVVTKGRSLWRFLDSGYRANIALLKSYLKADLPKSNSERLTLIDTAISAQSAEANFQRLESSGAAFGKAWNGDQSPWPRLKAYADWYAGHENIPATVWSRIAALSDEAFETVRITGKTMIGSWGQSGQLINAVITVLALDIVSAFGSEDLGKVNIDDLIARLRLWTAERESLSRYIIFVGRGRKLIELGVPTIVASVMSGRLMSADLVPTFDQAYALILRDILFKAWPELRAFDGDSHDRLVGQFRQYDRARIELAKEQIAIQHGENRPKGAAGVGPLGVLNAEMAKKRSHLPIRLLLEKAGLAIQKLKPVFMMSPLSVAQFLKPGTIDFDLLVMDEASQIEPVDALGAIARVRQLVVVGDERQLPPTSFFKKLTGEEEPEDDDNITIQAKDAESILDLCLAKGAPHRMLSWHYRSKHQSLIAVSNREFYENRLFIVPSPYDAVAGMGLKFHLLKDTYYERGTSRTNPLEARRIAEAVIAHVRQNPEQSLGVATFSVSQRQAVLKELELLRRANPDVEAFFGGNNHEPFFVKNLENIQGDERDVIFISVGYGKTKEGYLAHAFGPLSGEGGERRLNVLISRAKLRCEVFSNFTGADIDLERTRARGVAALKLFMTFAETGNFGLGETTGADHDSEFELQVCQRLQTLGYDVKAQIGASGFRVDLAVSDPEKPGRFVLGIECDGVQYHSSRSARDRDRLRQQVLEAHGWIIHRIWSADWYLRPNEELRKVEDAIIAARAEWRERDEEGFKAAQAVPVSFEIEEAEDQDIIRAVLHDSQIVRDDRAYYKEASFKVNQTVEPHEAPLAEMAGYVFKIVEIEGPVHIDEVATRIRMLWGLQKAGSRIRSAVSQAARVCSARGLIKQEGDFYRLPEQDIVVRDRSLVISQSLRKAEMLPPHEIKQSILKTVTDNYGAGQNELVQAVSRSFGYASTSAQLRGRIEEVLSQFLVDGALEEKGGLLILPPAT